MSSSYSKPTSSNSERYSHKPRMDQMAPVPSRFREEETNGRYFQQPIWHQMAPAAPRFIEAETNGRSSQRLATDQTISGTPTFREEETNGRSSNRPTASGDPRFGEEENNVSRTRSPFQSTLLQGQGSQDQPDYMPPVCHVPLCWIVEREKNPRPDSPDTYWSGSKNPYEDLEEVHDQDRASDSDYEEGWDDQDQPSTSQPPVRDPVPLFPHNPPLNRHHGEYVQRMLALEDRTLVVNAPHGSRPSSCIVSGALNLAYYRPGTHLIVTQNSETSKLLMDQILAQEFMLEKDGNEIVVMRYVDFDCPEFHVDFKPLLKKLLLRMVQERPKSHYGYVLHAALWLQEYAQFPRELMSPEAQYLLRENSSYKLRTDNAFWLRLYLEVARPNIILVTKTSFKDLTDVLENVTTVQIHLAEALHKKTFIALKSQFPDACFGLVGNSQLRRPGDSMTQAMIMEPKKPIWLEEIYECHPKVAAILGEIFYGGSFFYSMEHGSKEYLRARPGIFKNPDFPLLFVDNPDVRETGFGKNLSENVILDKLINSITAQVTPRISEEEICIVTLDEDRLHPLHRYLDKPRLHFKVLGNWNPDRFEISIICCSNYGEMDFENAENSIPKLLKVGKQATILIGNFKEMKKSDIWRQFLDLAEENNSVLSGQKI